MQPLKRKGFAATSSSVLPHELVGRVFESRYQIERQVGQGGIGVVYRATDTKLGGRPVAVKVLNDKMGARSKQRRRFEREAKALAALTHPHVVAVSDYGMADETPYLVMELLEGRSLSQVITEDAPLAPERALSLMRQLLAGLCYVHERGIVHRDLKSANVFVQRMPGGGERVKLLDFGLAKFLEPSDEATLTASGEIFGTPGYMPPEQWLGKPVDARADVYSACVILYELLAGQKPFVGPLAEVAQRQLTGVVPRLSDAGTGRSAHPKLDALFARGMAASARDRYRDAQELVRALEQVPKVCVEILSEHARATLERERHEAVTRPASSEERTVAVVRTAPSERARHEPGLLARAFHAAVAFCAGVLRAGALLVAVVSGLFIVAAVAVIFVFKHPELEQSREALRAVLPAVEARPSADQREQGPTPPAAPPAPSADIQTGDIRIAARDPWRAPVPAALRTARSLMLQRRRASEKTFDQVREYNAKHPDDARGHLVLGALYLQRSWFDDGLTQYEHALRIDPSARGDERAAQDLLGLVEQPDDVWRRAHALLARGFGEALRTRVDQAAEKTRRPGARARLLALATELTASP